MEIIITGYHVAGDELIAFEAPVPGALIAEARKRAGMPDDDQDAWGGAWPLTEADATAIVGDVPPGLVYFLEAVSC